MVSFFRVLLLLLESPVSSECFKFSGSFLDCGTAWDLLAEKSKIVGLCCMLSRNDSN